MQGTKLQRDLEIALGQPIREIITDALRTQRGLRGASRHLSISRPTLRIWCAELGIRPEQEVAKAILGEVA